MALMSTATGGSDFEPVPEGAHLARCVTVVDLGLQETTWNGQVKYKHKVYIAFEVPAIRVEWEKDGQHHEGPALIGQMYTNSIGDKANLGKHLVSWRGKSFTEAEKQGFDLFTILDVPCQISVIHNKSGDRTYANISGIMGLPPGVDVPTRETDILAYTPSDPEKAQNFDKLPQWMQDKCLAGQTTATANPSAPQEPTENPVPPEYQNGPGNLDADIPF